MTQGLGDLRATISQAASERGLLVFDGEPDVSKLASVAWRGDWLSFLNLAQQANVRLLYIWERRYDPNEAIYEATGDPDLIANGLKEGGVLPANEFEDEAKAWLRERIRERLAPWDARQDEVFSVSCVWAKDHVAHYWREYASWITECLMAIDAVLEEAELIEQENRKLRSQEEARRLHEYAMQLAQHVRFPEATSEEKREYMASQLFPDLTDDGWPTSRAIARRAMLIYWWDIEPAEKATKDERARGLYAQGESIRNIAAILKMSEAKVKAAIMGGA